MAVAPETAIMALYCDFENVALGVRDANYDKFDIKPVLERLLLKGSIVVKKAYCDWERYKGFKAAMHEANFELIEIPHLRQSGKNSADIRLVVDALDLCYTKSHVDTFVIISGDSDFSPLVSKLRENAKYVIGVGVKQSTSDLLIANCDEFIFYDDLVREIQRSARRDSKEVQPAVRRSPEEDAQRKAELEARRSKAVELAVATFDALIGERGDSSKIWASMLKEAIKRRKPDFNESYYGFRAFGNLLEEAQKRGLLEIGRDEKSGTYVQRSNGSDAGVEAAAELGTDALPLSSTAGTAEGAATDHEQEQAGGRRKGQGRRKTGEKGAKRIREPKSLSDEGLTGEGVDGGGQEAAGDRGLEPPSLPASVQSSAPEVHASPEPVAAPQQSVEAASEAEMPHPAGAVQRTPAAKPRTAGRRRTGEKTGTGGTGVSASEPSVVVVETVAPTVGANPADLAPVKKPVPRPRRPRKPKAAPETE
ncbi:NYN domain-containing protein [Accumulibacter sp.]|uniref:NYN domain-containing protein n=1 Tax=Accumulibacter sp. TaxID=2053492 RepID=UPI0028C45893|nr:NYN domain-containing protein [Accumulibacter sp.]